MNMLEFWHVLRHRSETAYEFIAWVGGERPWALPIFIGLLLLAGIVSLAQATHVAPLIYTLF